VTKEQRDALFTEFVATQSAQLVHFAWLLCGDRGLAEDLVQTALEKSYLRWIGSSWATHSRTYGRQ